MAVLDMGVGGVLQSHLKSHEETRAMPYTILYVEDEIAIIELVQLILDHPDLKLETACCGADGVKMAGRLAPDLMIVDVMMPDVSGWSVYEEIRKQPTLAKVPIVMLTAQLHQYRVMKEFAHSEIDAYITKPFDAGELRATIERMLKAELWQNGRPIQRAVLPQSAPLHPESTEQKQL